MFVCFSPQPTHPSPPLPPQPLSFIRGFLLSVSLLRLWQAVPKPPLTAGIHTWYNSWWLDDLLLFLTSPQPCKIRFGAVTCDTVTTDLGVSDGCEKLFYCGFLSWRQAVRTLLGFLRGTCVKNLWPQFDLCLFGFQTRRTLKYSNNNNKKEKKQTSEGRHRLVWLPRPLTVTAPKSWFSISTVSLPSCLLCKRGHLTSRLLKSAQLLYTKGSVANRCVELFVLVLF